MRPFPRLPGSWLLAALGILVALAAVAGFSVGYYLRLDLPDVDTLEDYSPPVMTRVLAEDGSLLDTFFEQRRILIESRDIPEVFVRALVAVEDSSFFDHAGVDYSGVLRAAWRDVATLRPAQGASTLTQQLARNLFLHPDKTFRRKFQELLLALEIERRYTKQEILRFYCNQVYMGHGRYGLEAASRFYFDKPARELDLAEAALLAGVIQRPEALSPFKDRDRATRRRDYVLARMVREGLISEAEAARARRVPVPPRPPHSERRLAPYFVEEVRRWLKARFGDASLYRAGLEVRTTVDPRLQAIANEAVEEGLSELDRRQGWRGVGRRVPEGQDPRTWEAEAWRDGIALGEVTDGVVVAGGPGPITVRVGARTGTLGSAELAWTARGGRLARLRPGDILRVRPLSLQPGGTAELSLEQEPAVEAALVAIEPGTGAIRALVGGFDYERSEFDRAIQARRQTGSAFKPFVYATALAQRFTPADVLIDQPTVFIDPQQAVPYAPKNFGDRYDGAVTLRRALEKSANVATVGLLREVGTQAVIDTARRLGITSELRPYPSLALGAFEVSLLELTSAYGTFANQGVRVEPHGVEEVRDRHGAVVFVAEPEVRDALSPQIAYLMNRLLEGVITDGTGHAAASLGKPLAGKTGTTDDYTDAWFIGYSPQLAVGVWVGFDTKRTLGDRETGAGAALPIWRRFMERALEDAPAVEFETPPGISYALIDRETGLRASPAAGCQDLLREAFVAGSEPTAYCTRAHHLRLRLPHTFHSYALTDQGEISMPEAELAGLLSDEPGVAITDRRSRLVYTGPDAVVSLPLRVVPGGGADTLPQRIRDRLPEELGAGRDGRRPRIVVFGG
jgi:penicillin-binding protein 1A